MRCPSDRRADSIPRFRVGGKRKTFQVFKTWKVCGCANRASTSGWPKKAARCLHYELDLGRHERAVVEHHLVNTPVERRPRSGSANVVAAAVIGCPLEHTHVFPIQME